MSAEGLKKQPHLSDVPITMRKPITREVPAEHLDRLLVSLCDIAADAGIEAAAQTIVATAAEIVDGAAVGICIADESGKQIVIRRTQRASHTSAPDPTRLFPEFAKERVIPV